VGNEFLLHGHFAGRNAKDSSSTPAGASTCTAMHRRFTLQDEDGTAGIGGKRIDDLLSFDRRDVPPVDPKISGPTVCDLVRRWCNALIGHIAVLATPTQP